MITQELYQRLRDGEQAAWDELEQMSERDQTVAIKALVSADFTCIHSRFVAQAVSRLAPYIGKITENLRTFAEPPPDSEWAKIRAEADALINPER